MNRKVEDHREAIQEIILSNPTHLSYLRTPNLRYSSYYAGARQRERAHRLEGGEGSGGEGGGCVLELSMKKGPVLALQSTSVEPGGGHANAKVLG